MTSLKMCCLLLPLAALLLLLTIVPTVTEVVPSMSDCKGFVLDESLPNVLGILEGGRILDQNRYKPICQTFDNSRSFVTLYDTTNRIPVFSAYKYTGSESGRPDEDWKIEPELEDITDIKNMWPAISKNQAGNDDYSDQRFDRGHLFPSSYALTENDKQSTFTLTNIVPQHSTFNQGSWARMEICIKCVLEKYCINSNGVKEGFLVTGAQPGQNNMNSRVKIPSMLWSAFCCYSRSEKGWLASAHWGDNIPEPGVKHLQTKTLADLQNVLGIQVFPGTQCPLHTTVTHLYPNLNKDCRLKCPKTISTTSASPSSTSAPLPSTSVPLSTTSAPLSTTSASHSTTSAPLSTTSAPRSTTSAPLSTTPAPLSTTSAPRSTTSAPLSTTSAPLSTTSAPLSTTSAPCSSTSAPLSTTSAPRSTTSAPLSTTSAPFYNTCPSFYHICPSFYHICPSFYHICPSFYHICPSFYNTCPSFYHICPSFFHICPSYYHICPSFYNTCPSFYHICPSFYHICPSFYHICPSFYHICPFFYHHNNHHNHKEETGLAIGTGLATGNVSAAGTGSAAGFCWRKWFSDIAKILPPIINIVTQTSTPHPNIKHPVFTTVPNTTATPTSVKPPAVPPRFISSVTAITVSMYCFCCKSGPTQIFRFWRFLQHVCQFSDVFVAFFFDG